MIKVYPNVSVQMEEHLGKYKNMMVQGGLDWALDLMAGLTPSMISHVAVGADGTQVSIGDEQLRDERARKQVTTLERDSGAVIIEGFFTEQEANFPWREIGLFAGATDALGTGVLLARAVVTESKDSRRTATVTWELGLRNA